MTDGYSTRIKRCIRIDQLNLLAEEIRLQSPEDDRSFLLMLIAEQKVRLRSMKFTTINKQELHRCRCEDCPASHRHKLNIGDVQAGSSSFCLATRTVNKNGIYYCNLNIVLYEVSRCLREPNRNPHQDVIERKLVVA